MDPSIFLPYSPPSGLPQESKLATYMNRSPSTPTHSSNQTVGQVSSESSPTAIQKNGQDLIYAPHQQIAPGPPPMQQVLLGEFIPITYFNPTNIMPEAPESSPPATLPPMQANPQVHQENVGGTTYFYSTNDSLNTTGCLSSSASLVAQEACIGQMVPPALSPYASQVYTGTPTHMSNHQNQGLAASFYLPKTILDEIYHRNKDAFLQTDLRQYPDLPENVGMYSALTPLESAAPHSLATSYRVAHRSTGDHYALRRLHNCTAVGLQSLDVWKQIDHPNVVRLLEAFPTKAFGDHSMVLVYDYHPGCTTLVDKYLATGPQGGTAENNGAAFHDPFSNDPDAPRPYTHQKNTMLRAVACGALLPEAVLWSLLVQLTAGLRAVHAAGLACRTLDTTKVVMNGCRVRIAWCGIADLLHPTGNDVLQAQQEDLTSLGRLALALACRSAHCESVPASMDLVTRSYSADLKNVLLYLLTAQPGVRRNLTDLMPMIGARFYTQVEALERRADAFEGHLAHEIDNGRLLRILIKLGVVNERSELNCESSWSETGNRYMLKLFRDYLFHSVMEDGRPWIDMAHLTHNLNQLDGGSKARVHLMSRDERSVLVVSYAELKHCLNQAFGEVMAAASARP